VANKEPCPSEKAVPAKVNRLAGFAAVAHKWRYWLLTACALALLVPVGDWVLQIVIIRDKEGNEIVLAKVPKDGSFELLPEKGVEGGKKEEPKEDAVKPPDGKKEDFKKDPVKLPEFKKEEPEPETGSIARFIALVKDKDSTYDKRANACVALGKQGQKANAAVPAMTELLEELLKSKGSGATFPKEISQCVAKVVAGLGSIGPDAEASLPS
jgi:hypothetical protein